MFSKKIYTIFTIALFVTCGLLLAPKPSVAAKITLKVSHQFAAGDVRDLMAHAFGDMVTKRPMVRLRFDTIPLNPFLNPKSSGMPCKKAPWI